MRIALVTNKKLHHKYWISQLYVNNDVILIIHPTGINQSFVQKIKQKKIFYYGFFYFLLKLIGLIYNKFFKGGLNQKNKIAEKKYFSQYENEYQKIPKEIVHHVETVNSAKTLQLIKDNNIDVVCFLGGDIAKKDFINSARICLNYHSGISPFYNGTKTNYHTVSDFRPNFAGGTLMKMNERIDGGEILMHYLCSIARSDKAEDLFMKGIIGAVKTFQEFFDNYDFEINGVAQKKSFKFVRNIDWTIINNIKLNKFYKYDRMKIYERQDCIINYINKDYKIEDLHAIVLKKILS